MTLKALNADEVRSAVSMSTAIDAVRKAFVALAAGEFEVPVRTGVGDGRFLTMTAWHRPSRTTTVKAVGVVPGRDPVIAGAIAHLASDSSTTLVLDAAVVTCLRTGAVVGVATDLLAAEDSEHLVLIGLGSQAADQLAAVRAVRPISRVTLVGRSLSSVDAFRARCARGLTGLEVTVSLDPATAVATADIVCCATPATEPLFPAWALPEHVHVNAVGAYRPSMRELPDELLASGQVVVDQVEAALEESGEVQHAIAAGHLQREGLIELGSLLAGTVAPPSGRRTVFKSVGLAIQDWAIASAVAEASIADRPGAREP